MVPGAVALGAIGLVCLTPLLGSRCGGLVDAVVSHHFRNIAALLTHPHLVHSQSSYGPRMGGPPSSRP